MNLLTQDFFTPICKYINRHLPEILVFLFSLIIFSIYASWSARMSWVFGDEPENIMVAQSIVKYQTIDLTQVYENKDYYYYHGADFPNPTTTNSNWGILTTHSYVLPLIIVPAVILAELTSPSLTHLLIFLELAFISALGMVVIYRLSQVVTNNTPISLLTAAIVALSLPMILYSHLVFPDLLEGIFFTIGILIVYQKRFSKLDIIILCILFPMLTWLHPKTITYSGMLLIITLVTIAHKQNWQIRELAKNWKPYAIVSSYTGSLLSFLTFNYFAFGNFTFDAQIKGTGDLFSTNPIIGILGNLFDQTHGIFLTYPLAVLMVPGGLLLFLKHRRVFVLMVSTVGIFFLINMTFWDWFGGFSPAPRYMVPLMPFIGLCITVVLIHIKTLMNWLIAFILFLWGFMQVILLPLAPISYMYVLDGKHDLFKNLPGPFKSVIDFWPHFFPVTENTHVSISIISLGILVITILIILDPRLLHKRNTKPRATS